MTIDSSTALRWLRTTPFGLPVVPDVYISVHGSDRATFCAGSRAAAGRKKILIGAVAGWTGAGTEMDEPIRFDRKVLADFLDHADQFVLDNKADASALSTMN